MWCQHSHLLQEYKLDETNPTETQNHPKPYVLTKEDRLLDFQNSSDYMYFNVVSLCFPDTNSDTVMFWVSLQFI